MTILNEAIREAAMLVSLRTTSWRATTLSNTESRKAEQAAGARRGSRRTYIELMAGNDKRLRRVRAIQQAARVAHLDMTVPWSTSGGHGPGLLPTMEFQKYLAEINKYKKELKEDALPDFLDHYDHDREEARKNIGLSEVEAFKLYPPKQDLANRFQIRTEFTPIPAGAQFSGLPKSVQERLEEAYEERVQEMYKRALSELVKRVRDDVDEFATRMASAKRIFESTSKMLDEYPRMLGRFNIGEDPDIEAIAKEVEGFVSSFDTEMLRDEDHRVLIVDRARELSEFVSRTWTIEEEDDDIEET